MVPETGLEPARVAPLPPQGNVSTNFTTPADAKKSPAFNRACKWWRFRDSNPGHPDYDSGALTS